MRCYRERQSLSIVSRCKNMQGTVIYLQRIGEGTFALLPACFREPKKVSKTMDFNGAGSPPMGFPVHIRPYCYSNYSTFKTICYT